jgi:hypothetical protein
LLLMPSDDGFLLPSLEIPRWQRVAENLSSRVRTELGYDAACVFTLEDVGLMDLPKAKADLS